MGDGAGAGAGRLGVMGRDRVAACGCGLLLTWCAGGCAVLVFLKLGVTSARVLSPCSPWLPPSSGC